MKRKDQLNVAIASELKEKWRQWCTARGTSVTALIEALALHCVEGEPFPLPNVNVSSEDLKELVRAEVQSAIAVQMLAMNDLKKESNITQNFGESDGGLDPETADTIAVEDGLSHGEISEIYGKTGSTVRTWANPKGGGKPRTTPDKKYAYNPDKKLWYLTQNEEKSNAQ
jgi:hypothetical protein